MRKIFLLLLAISLGWANFIFAQYQYPFQNPELCIDERITDLISRLTLEEKESLMLYNAQSVEMLQIPSYNWWNECLHGVARAGRATVFPQAIGLAATFNEELIKQVGEVISDEGRAKYNEAVNRGIREQYLGLTYWTPNINIFRDPRWGRGQETYGEDPFLTGRIGLAFVKGIQGDDPKYLKAAACAKHFAVHSGPEKVRHKFNAVVSNNDLWNTYLPAFKTLVDSGVAGVMCAYNRTNDEPCCGSNTLLTKILRNDWNFKGYIVSDCWALQDIWAEHQYVPGADEAAALAIKNSVNVNCGVVYKNITEAVSKGLINEKEVDNALGNALRILFRLGWFDKTDNTPWSTYGAERVASNDHIKFARKTAAQSIVLIKNNDVLPLSKDIKNVLVTGPNATSMEALWANYNGYSDQMVTVLEGVLGKVKPSAIVNFNEGCRLTDDFNFRGLWHTGSADAIIAVIGINSMIEGEEGDAILSKFSGDRNDIQLPANQIEFIKTLKKSGKPVITVIMAGSALSLKEIEPYSDAILYAWYPGEQGGNAIADVIFGDYNPSGRLPITLYNSIDDLPPFDDYAMKGRTYRYFNGKVQYPFGFGLSYSNFEYSDFKIKKQTFSKQDKNIDLDLTIRNLSNYDGDEVVQVYCCKLDINPDRPLKSLVSFVKVNIPKGTAKNVRVVLPIKNLEWYNLQFQNYIVEPGQYEIMVGRSSLDIKWKTIVKII